MQVVCHAGALHGIEALSVRVELRLTRGLPRFDIVGLAETAVREARVRVGSAIEASGFDFPQKRIVLNLAPADLRKGGSSFDLPIAIGVLASSGSCSLSDLGSTFFAGELSLDGELQPIPGVLSQLCLAARLGLERAVIPEKNAVHAALITGIDVYCANRLEDVVGYLGQNITLPTAKEVKARLLEGVASVASASHHNHQPDLGEIYGQFVAKRALEIAAIGNHNLLMSGPPGSGKTMLARRLPGLLPPPTEEESLMIATIAGVNNAAPSLLHDGVQRPFRAPHHSISDAALIGGGIPIRPGEVTLAHGGVLFLDEFPEFKRNAIEALRVSMEEGWVDVARVHHRARMPAAPLVVAAMNPCPCGYAGDDKHLCMCPPDRIERYQARISGPLLDRFDLHVHVPPVPIKQLAKGHGTENSEEVRARIMRGRQFALQRESAKVDGSDSLHAAAMLLLERATEKYGLSARAWHKVQRVARSIADLELSEQAGTEHVAEALQYRFVGLLGDDHRTSQRHSIGDAMKLN